MSGLRIGIVGMGPRGLSVLERLCANERASPGHSGITVHVVDPAAPGAGSVWRTDQSRHLLMNTVTSQITVYTDASSRIDGPIEPGPSLWEWTTALTDADADTMTEARTLGPNSYPTRAFYGSYLRDCFHRIVAGAPAHVTVRVHRSQAVAMADTDGSQAIRLADGTRLNNLDAVVLAQGHVSARLTRQQERTAGLARTHHLRYITPANPADVDLSDIAPHEPVLLRGLGLNFFDYLALLTAGRGGTFDRSGRKLRYLPSGREPLLYASSRRGVPYHARGENEKGAFGRYLPRLLTPERIEQLRRHPMRFTQDVWPLIAREVECVYYETLLESRGAERAGFGARYLTDPDPAAALDAYRIDPADRWSWEQLTTPYRGLTFAGRAEFRDWLLGHLAADVAHARAGNVRGPLKAALDVLRDLRNEVRLAVDHGGLTGESHHDELDRWYTPLNAYLSIGPPVSRIEEMIALIEAGVLELTGPGTELRINPVEPAFHAVSTEVPGPTVRARVLIEARLPEPDLRRTADPLLRHLVDTRQAMPYRIARSNGVDHETGGLAVTERPYRVLDARGRPHPHRFAYGIPTEAVHWATAAGIRPGVDSVTLADSDAIARAVLVTARRTATQTDLTGVIV